MHKQNQPEVPNNSQALAQDYRKKGLLSLSAKFENARYTTPAAFLKKLILTYLRGVAKKNAADYNRARVFLWIVPRSHTALLALRLPLLTKWLAISEADLKNTQTQIYQQLINLHLYNGKISHALRLAQDLGEILDENTSHTNLRPSKFINKTKPTGNTETLFAYCLASAKIYHHLNQLEPAEHFANEATEILKNSPTTNISHKVELQTLKLILLITRHTKKPKPATKAQITTLIKQNQKDLVHPEVTASTRVWAVIWETQVGILEDRADYATLIPVLETLPNLIASERLKYYTCVMACNLKLLATKATETAGTNEATAARFELKTLREFLRHRPVTDSSYLYAEADAKNFSAAYVAVGAVLAALARLAFSEILSSAPGIFATFAFIIASALFFTWLTKHAYLRLKAAHFTRLNTDYVHWISLQLALEPILSNQPLSPDTESQLRAARRHFKKHGSLIMVDRCNLLLTQKPSKTARRDPSLHLITLPQ